MKLISLWKSSSQKVNCSSNKTHGGQANNENVSPNSKLTLKSFEINGVAQSSKNYLLWNVEKPYSSSRNIAILFS